MYMRCMPVGPLQANCYLIWDEDLRGCAVDPGGEPARIAALLEKEGVTLEAILVTHGHFDHVDGVQGLHHATSAPVYCSRPVVPVLSGVEDCDATGYPVPAMLPERIKVVGDGDLVKVGSFTVSVISTPGHTPGDMTYEIGGHLFCGDLLFHGSVGRTDFPGGDFSALLRSVSRLAGAFPSSTPVHPGHMQSTTIGEELAHNPFLQGLEIDG
ncbi:MAG: MBL fold metallo-hydrolase [Actinobacteria bacterium]|nr:MBL fold metallo-hydrolase [Actinomycetota bacterium]